MSPKPALATKAMAPETPQAARPVRRLRKPAGTLSQNTRTLPYLGKLTKEALAAFSNADIEEMIKQHKQKNKIWDNALSIFLVAAAASMLLVIPAGIFSIKFLAIPALIAFFGSFMACVSLMPVQAAFEKKVKQAEGVIWLRNHEKKKEQEKQSQLEQKVCHADLERMLQEAIDTTDMESRATQNIRDPEILRAELVREKTENRRTLEQALELVKKLARPEP